MLPAEAARERGDAVIAVRALSLAVAATLALAAGCGDEEGTGSPTAPAASTDETADLRITLDVDGKGGEPARTRRLVCAPNIDARYRGCDAALALPPDPAAPTPPQTACTEIYGGPDVATITGTLRGEPIDATLTRANGCEIERFDRFTPLLQELFPGFRPGSAIGA